MIALWIIMVLVIIVFVFTMGILMEAVKENQKRLIELYNFLNEVNNE